MSNIPYLHIMLIRNILSSKIRQNLTLWQHSNSKSLCLIVWITEIGHLYCCTVKHTTSYPQLTKRLAFVLSVSRQFRTNCNCMALCCACLHQYACAIAFFFVLWPCTLCSRVWIIIAWRIRMRGNYGTHFVCMCVCVCVLPIYKLVKMLIQ